MGLRDEWEELRGAAARVAADALRLTTVTTLRASAGAPAALISIRSDAQLDRDTALTIDGDGCGLEPCHRAAVAFTSELAEARLRMLARVASALLL